MEFLSFRIHSFVENTDSPTCPMCSGELKRDAIRRITDPAKVLNTWIVNVDEPEEPDSPKPYESSEAERGWMFTLTSFYLNRSLFQFICTIKCMHFNGTVLSLVLSRTATAWLQYELFHDRRFRIGKHFSQELETDHSVDIIFEPGKQFVV